MCMQTSNSTAVEWGLVSVDNAYIENRSFSWYCLLCWYCPDAPGAFAVLCCVCPYIAYVFIACVVLRHGPRPWQYRGRNNTSNAHTLWMRLVLSLCFVLCVSWYCICRCTSISRIGRLPRILPTYRNPTFMNYYKNKSRNYYKNRSRKVKTGALASSVRFLRFCAFNSRDWARQEILNCPTACRPQCGGHLLTSKATPVRSITTPHTASMSEASLVTQMHLVTIVVGGRDFWLIVLAGGPPYILYTYLIYQLYTLCKYTTIYTYLVSCPQCQTPACQQLCSYLLRSSSIRHKVRFRHPSGFRFLCRYLRWQYRAFTLA